MSGGRGAERLPSQLVCVPVNVGTPIDAATARKDESYLAFVMRSSLAGVHVAWHTEQQRLARRPRASAISAM